jgi:hypothetical protein
MRRHPHAPTLDLIAISYSILPTLRSVDGTRQGNHPKHEDGGQHRKQFRHGELLSNNPCIDATIILSGTTVQIQLSLSATSPGEVHDIALKAAETDATKRALATFGRPFGLELYRGGRAASSQKPLPAPPQVPAAVPVPADVGLGFHPDDTTPIPRPSRYYGRRQDLVTRLFTPALCGW